MPTIKIVGVVLLVLGAGLGYWGWDMSDSMGSQLNEAFNGTVSDDVMYRYIGGAVSAAVGLFLLLKG